MGQSGVRAQLIVNYDNDQGENGEGSHGAISSPNEAMSIESSVLIALYSVFILTMGFMLIGDWSARDTEAYFTAGECYTMVLMNISLIWTTVMLWRTRKAVKRSGTTPRGFQQGGARAHKAHGGSLLVKCLAWFAAFSGLLTVSQSVDYMLETCSLSLELACSLGRLLFIVAQVLLIVYSSSRVTFEKTGLNGAMVMHIIVTNIILYTWTFIKSKEGISSIVKNAATITGSSVKELVVVSNHSFVELRSSNNTSSSHCEPTIYSNVFPWLYPFYLEFCLTASAILAELWLELPSPQNTTENHAHDSEESPPNTNRINSSPAMFIGVSCFVLQVGTIAYTIIADAETGSIIWHAARITTSVVIILLAGIGLNTLGKCRQDNNSLHFELDEVLLLVGNLGALALALFRGYSGLMSLASDKHTGYAAGALVTSLIVIIGTLFQTAFISKALHRRPTTQGCVSTASIAMVMAFLNSGLWLCNTIDLESLTPDISIYRGETKAKIDYFLIHRYHSIMIVILMLCSPITIFYHIHSAVALYRVSNKHKVIENQQSVAAENQQLENHQSDAMPENRTVQNFILENENLLQRQNSLRHRWREFRETVSLDDRQSYSSQFEELDQQLGTQPE